MKRIKYMLLSLLVLATVGGLYAFKLKQENFCLYKVVNNSCPRQVTKPEACAVNVGGDMSFLPKANCPAQIPVTSCTYIVIYEVN